MEKPGWLKFWKKKLKTDSLSHDLARVLLLSIPLIVGGILHMLVVQKDLFKNLKKPIHTDYFGKNKTWRGFVVMIISTWPGVFLAQSLERVINFEQPFLTGESTILLAVVLGLGYCLAELPNSFMKRRLGIHEGQTSDKYRWLFIIIDQSDSAFGCLLAYAIVIEVPVRIFAATIIFGTCIHLLINVLLFKIKVRKNPF